MGNELKNHYGYVETTIDYVKSSLDPYRLVSCVSNTGHREQDSPENDPLGLSDIILQNSYLKTPERMIDPIHEKWPDKPIFFSEFGLGKFTSPSLDGVLPGLSDWHKTIRGQNLFVVGASLWTFNDYRSAYVETLESENRAWGLVNAWRQKRRLYEQVQKEYSPVKGIQLDTFLPNDGKTKLRIPIKGREDYPAYAMKDYWLEWVFRNKQGNIIGQHSQELPLLRPEDGEWKGEIEWDKLEEEAAEFQIRLLSTNGYVRYENRIPFQLPQVPKIAAVIPGNHSLRVSFRKDFGAEEYLVICTNAEDHSISSHKTIDSHIDIDGLMNGQEYQLQLFAGNAMGQSLPSQTVLATPNGNELSPIIWDSFIADGKLIIGYSGAKEDEQYQLRYGQEKQALTKEFTTSVRGMLSIEVRDQHSLFFQMRRFTGNTWSNWSEIKHAVAPSKTQLE